MELLNGIENHLAFVVDMRKKLKSNNYNGKTIITMAFPLISQDNKQYIFASFNSEKWWFSYKRFVLTEGENINGQFISSGWFSQSISQASPEDYLFMIIEFSGDFSYISVGDCLFPSLVIELNEIMTDYPASESRQVSNFIVNNCPRVSNAFLFDFGENVYNPIMENLSHEDNVLITTDCIENNTISLRINCRKYVDNNIPSLYISNPEFTLIR
jgi:hypothetical protein